jgi:hypothetical protein
MDGFESVFNHSIDAFSKVDDTQQLFQEFRRHKDIYGYICNQDSPPDKEAIDIAKRINPKMVEEYINILKTRKILGYTGITKYPYQDEVDSRHIMMSIICFDTIKGPLNHVIEIGGGFGNWLFLNQHRGIKRWSIIDLPHVGRLQTWCLTQHNINPSTYNIVSAFNYDNIEHADLVIGSHSLSEFSLNTFKEYFDKVIRNSKYLFYAFHRTSLSNELLSKKIDMIHSVFTPIVNIASENGYVLNLLYINRVST